MGAYKKKLLEYQEKKFDYITEENFICPKCNKKVYLEKDSDLTDGQESEWMAGFRLCPECGAYEQIEKYFYAMGLDEEEKSIKGKIKKEGDKSVDCNK